jgi:chromosome segregation ATPase
MDAKILQALRPRDASTDGIASSIERMQAVLIELRGEQAAIQGNRRTVLLTGTNADLDKVDGRIRALQTDIERIEATIEALRPDLAVARGRERIEQIETLRVKAQEAAESFRAFWFEKYEALASEIAAGVESEQTARQARRDFDDAVKQAERDAEIQAAGGVLQHELPDIPLGYVGARSMKSPALLICLPSVTPARPIAWPNGHALTKPALTGEAAAYV